MEEDMTTTETAPDAAAPRPDPFTPEVIDGSSESRPNIFESRLALLHAALTTADPGRALSIGSGTGSFEEQLRERFGLQVEKAVEPSENLAAKARSRGLTVEVAKGQDLRFDPASYDTIYYHGSSFGFIPDDELEPTFRRNFDALRPGGRLVLTDVPKESPLGILLFTLQRNPDLDTEIYDDLISGTSFFNYRTHTYKPNWHRTGYYIELLTRIGFTNLTFKQTVLANPPYQNDRAEDPIDGYDKGNYIAIIAQKPNREAQR
jgi:SAM-dependent methyltransferase